MLLLAAAVALIWANSPASGAYERVFDTVFALDFGPIHLDETFRELINDGLMAIFFFVVGLEIKRELVLGELKDRGAALLPVLAAIGGMLGPAVVYLIVNAGVAGEASQGWGIPMATDIAFAVGILVVLGDRVPPAARLFLLALAIADDIGVIAVIAIFYSNDLQPLFLGLAVAALAVVWIASKVGIRSMAFYVPIALISWYFMLESGVHATLVGVALGFLTPARPLYRPEELEEKSSAILEQFGEEAESVEANEHLDHEALLLSEIAGESVSPLSRMEHRFVVWSSFVVIPLFALANVGVDLRGTPISTVLTSTVGAGVALGLLLGKSIGISLFAFLGVRMGIGRLPDQTSWRHMLGLALVAGIGFTVSLFVTALAFEDPALVDVAKVGVFAGSLASGLAGAAVLLTGRKPGRS